MGAASARSVLRTLTISDRLSIGGVKLSPGHYVILTAPQTTKWRVGLSKTCGNGATKMFSTLYQVMSVSAPVERAAVSGKQFTIRPG